MVLEGGVDENSVFSLCNKAGSRRARLIKL